MRETMRFYSGWSIVLLIFRGWTTNGIPSMADDITGSVDPAVVTARSNVQLSCTFSHDIYVFLHWVHPNPVVSVINVTTERFKLHIFDNKVVLTMCAVRESDGGEYMCVFSNALGSYAQIVQIHYLHPVSFLSLAGQTFSFFVDTSAQIECLAEHHQTIQWELANGAVIIGSDRVHSDQLPNGTSLTFENVLLSDTGTYYCIAKNNLTSKRIAYYLQVYDLPSISITPTVIDAPLQRRVFFTCSAGAPLLSDIKWHMEGRPLNSTGWNSQHQLAVSTVLELGPVAVTDAGSYVCTAIATSFNSNRSRNASTSAVATLNVCYYQMPLGNVTVKMFRDWSALVSWSGPIAVCSDGDLAVQQQPYSLQIRLTTDGINSQSYTIEVPSHYSQYNLIDLQPLTTYYVTVSVASIAGETTSGQFNITTVSDNSGPDILPIALGSGIGLLIAICLILTSVYIGYSVFIKKYKTLNRILVDQPTRPPRNIITSSVGRFAMVDNDCYHTAAAVSRQAKPVPPMVTTSHTLTEFSGLSTDVNVIPSTAIFILDFLGQGEFGVVFKACLHQTHTSQTVAVKTLKGFLSYDNITELLCESAFMKDFQHPNVLSLIGICVDGGPAPYLVMPYMSNGSLLGYLCRERVSLVLTSDSDENQVLATQKNLLDMMLQIAKGMEYLASKRVLHRDLAARNCMIDASREIKVADFGLSESIYSKNYFRQEPSEEAKLPVKWMAPESLSYGIFTEATDVWSFGVTCWEVCTGGKIPYPAVSPLSLPALLEQGERLHRPNNTASSDEMYSLMQSCWSADYQQRPSFCQLVTLTGTLLGSLGGFLQLQL